MATIKGGGAEAPGRISAVAMPLSGCILLSLLSEYRVVSWIPHVGIIIRSLANSSPGPHPDLTHTC